MSRIDTDRPQVLSQLLSSETQPYFLSKPQDTECSLVNDVVAFMLDHERAGYSCALSRAIDACDSPIEVLFLCAFIKAGVDDNAGLFFFGPRPEYLPNYHERDAGVFISIQQQYKVGDYKVDFYIEQQGTRGDCETNPTNGHGKLIVECDGHDFHDRTKEQAARDKARDRKITESGMPIFRFTGSELWKDSGACGAQCVAELCRQFYGKEEQK